MKAISVVSAFFLFAALGLKLTVFSNGLRVKWSSELAKRYCINNFDAI
jgi:hypothetical protein